MTTEVKKPKRQPQFRNVCYTCFSKPIMGGDSQTYNIYGEEICPTTKKLHYQGYVEFKRSMVLSSIKKSLGVNDAHIEGRKGSQQQAIDYCKKDGKVTEWGELKNQGKRCDLKETTSKILSGKLTCREILQTNPELYHTYGRTLDKTEEVRLSNVKRTWMTKGIWIYGPTGCGKTKYAYDFDPNLYKWRSDKGWQDFYNGEDTILIDDFRGGIAYNELLQMIDRYDYGISRRGKCPMPLLAKTIIITSSLHPKDVYKNLSRNDSLEQLYRRVQVVNMETTDMTTINTDMTSVHDCTSGQKGNTGLSDSTEKNSYTPDLPDPDDDQSYIEDDDSYTLDFND